MKMTNTSNLSMPRWSTFILWGTSPFPRCTVHALTAKILQKPLISSWIRCLAFRCPKQSRTVWITREYSGFYLNWRNSSRPCSAIRTARLVPIPVTSIRGARLFTQRDENTPSGHFPKTSIPLESLDANSALTKRVCITTAACFTTVGQIGWPMHMKLKTLKNCEEIDVKFKHIYPLHSSHMSKTPLKLLPRQP